MTRHAERCDRFGRVFTRRQALDRGLSDAQIHRGVRSGDLTRVSRGALAQSERWAELAAVERYRATVLAAVGRCTTGAVVSHVSAAVLHSLPLLRPDFDAVHFSEDGRGGGHRAHRILHRVSLAPADVSVLDGVAVTTPARTAVDVACLGSFEQAVCVLESALRSGVSAEDIDDVLARLGKRRGIGVARRGAAFADDRTESIGESWSRAQMASWPDIPLPRLQHEFRTPEGLFVARTDFDRDGVLVGEFDGMVKYAKDASDAVLAERRRETNLHALGVHVVRWTWSDSRRPGALHRLLRQGLERVGR
ncbi:type IV toxin-antitoxin system AbiEi family antitoxin domain-containing protein [Antrihabitans cavernicola]|uniref:type IV toxin-antitoxin system AbiEi family antitoxin domain-containing protein n=1 Tax=Antrihabitans cavernicola TaxID=2495913 RepID=UPI001659CD39|nr:type IV toxin-antitoxin system AbiEi family antitoxin domain-containing protein [Spelaeibacter cavernicola]